MTNAVGFLSLERAILLIGTAVLVMAVHLSKPAVSLVIETITRVIGL